MTLIIIGIWIAFLLKELEGEINNLFDSKRFSGAPNALNAVLSIIKNKPL